MYIPARSQRAHPADSHEPSDLLATMLWAGMQARSDLLNTGLLRELALGAIKVMLVGMALLSLRWGSDHSPHTLTLIAAALLSACGHALWRMQAVGDWAALVADAAVGLLLLISGPATTPLLLIVPIAIVAQGALTVGGLGALVGGVIGSLLAAGISLMAEPATAAVARDSALVAVLAGVIAWSIIRWTHDTLVRGQQARAIADGRARDAGAVELRAMRQSQRWQRDIQQLMACGSLDELRQMATSQAMVIAGANAHLDMSPAMLAGADPGERAVAIQAGDRPMGRLVLDCAELSDAQAEALQLLASVVGLRSVALESLAWRERLRGSVEALWCVAGLLNAPGTPDRQALLQLSSRLAAALQLDWIALMAPAAQHPIAPVFMAYGSDERTAPLSPAQLRVAAEAMRAERPLVRREGSATLACMPVRRAGRAAMVVVARGEAADDTTQSILLLLGDLLARRMDTPRAGS